MTAVADARDDILGTLKTAWDADPSSQDLDILWSDAPDNVTDHEEYLNNPRVGWARATVVHTPIGGLRTIGTSPNRKFERTGTIFVQLFTPTGKGLNLADQLVRVVLGAFEGVRTANGVWFRDSGFNEVGQNGNHHQTNVTVSFVYDENK